MGGDLVGQEGLHKVVRMIVSLTHVQVHGHSALTARRYEIVRPQLSLGQELVLVSLFVAAVCAVSAHQQTAANENDRQTATQERRHSFPTATAAGLQEPRLWYLFDDNGQFESGD